MLGLLRVTDGSRKLGAHMSVATRLSTCACPCPKQTYNFSILERARLWDQVGVDGPLVTVPRHRFRRSLQRAGRQER